MYCTRCGKEIPFGSDACAHCGTPVNQSQAPRENKIYETEDTSPLSMVTFIVILVIGMIPLVNIIMFCVWSVSSTNNVNTRNFARAYLIMLCFSFVIAFVYLFS